jgi:tRNA threonylcarbamoyladenosine biosynthesis protein TsaB
MLLAIDTSTNSIGLACYAEGGLLAEWSWESGRDHTTQLTAQIDLMLRRIHRGQADLRAVGVARGPGSWSGLRVGLSVAKGVALALDLPLIGVGTLEALALQHSGQGLPVVPLIRLGRERFATSDPTSGAPQNTTLATIATETGVPTLFCGDIDAEVRGALQQQLGARARFPSPAAALRRAGYVAEIAWRRLQAGDVDDLAALEPIYLGQPVRLAAGAPGS